MRWISNDSREGGLPVKFRYWLPFALSLICLFSVGCQSLQPASLEPQFKNPLAKYASWGWSGFRTPFTSENSRLITLDDYQPGKIPVVFIHGLLATPNTWTEMTTALQSDPQIADRYQIWVFQYSTGISYLQSASELRNELKDIVQKLDPSGKDPALQNMVLIGHSMGGLLVKQMISTSGNTMWEALSDQPFEFVEADPETKQQIRNAMFFEPVPFVSRAVFIATPHSGSDWVNRPIGSIGRQMIAFPKKVQGQYRQLISKNSGLLKDHYLNSIPTSLDHLAPGDPIMVALEQLKISDRVPYHSIIGIKQSRFGSDTGDGVVEEVSAHITGAVSELLVPATHTTIQKSDEATTEVRKILNLHLNSLEHNY
ncbi:esterase/lipase family protein [Rubinisphaera italica]|uniref:Alpha/beta hydrolase family protein n=1 Tax=Rubinisphaera italica TaxID=2527969 RepID=A0A5C5XLX6_9PLAN|nr:alpha/beta hydrolase [Rubinisphaera italica]TWT63884.1 Alpha/beta hydrolase family protein [Rubinisphaera italica]